MESELKDMDMDDPSIDLNQLDIETRSSMKTSDGCHYPEINLVFTYRLFIHFYKLINFKIGDNNPISIILLVVT